MPQPVFYDPERRRWRRLRLVTDPLGAVITVLIVIFVISIFRSGALPSLSLPPARRSFKALKERDRRRGRRRLLPRRPAHAAAAAAGQDEAGLRAAYYVPWDEGSFDSLREDYPEIDVLFPEWLHVITPDGRLQALAPGNKLFDVVKDGQVRFPDPQHPVMQFLKQEKAQTEVMPLINNFDPISNQWLTAIGDLLSSPSARAAFRQRLMLFLTSDDYRGISLDFEEIPLSAQPGFLALISELAGDLHPRGMKLYVNLPPNDNDYDYRAIAAASDGIQLMDYDQHVPETTSGPVAAQDWFVRNLRLALKYVPPRKLVAAIGNYGYDWAINRNGTVNAAATATVSDQEAWLHAEESQSSIVFDPDSFNPHYGYMDGNIRHEVWYLDAATALNQMRAGHELGVNSFALWRLGAEDGSLWSVWDKPRAADAATLLAPVPPGHDVDIEGRGEILRITQYPQSGARSVTIDPQAGLVTDEVFSRIPTPYQLQEYGWSPKQFAITFDDGPDPQWTPAILDILKKENASATFFLIGQQAEKFPALTDRIFRDGQEIGNHTFSHPDVSDMSHNLMLLEMNSTERLFEAKLGVKPLFFRPPYAIDEEPDTAGQVEPLRQVQDLGYITIGAKLDPRDWDTSDRQSPQQMAQAVFDQIAPSPLPPGCIGPPCGNVVLLHDGGGDRSRTVAALPLIIEGLRARGYEIVPLSQLIGKQRDQVMLPLSSGERWSALVDRFGFDLYGSFYEAIVLIFFLGNILMTLRLLLIGALALWDRLRRRRPQLPAADSLPAVAVLIPAFNEEQVIVNTVRAALASEYPADKLRVIVIDDGSRDSTVAVTRAAFPEEIRSRRLAVLAQPNGGKARALNFGFTQVQEEIFVGIDADTVIAPSAIARLVAHFSDPRVGAVAGNTRVGNRVNLWTRWQALEYITSQNFERRALDALGAVCVVPGALGAWRTAAVRSQGGYNLGTVAEDADLTMSLLQAGYRVLYEDSALAFTEAPVTANGLMRQRFRWSFGILQAIWKHRGAFRRGGALGWLALPNILIFQILLPMVSPAIDLMFVFGVLSYLVNRYFHPLTADPASVEKLAFFFVVFLVTDFIASALAFALEPRPARSEAIAGLAAQPTRSDDLWLLPQVWLQRFAYRQLFSLVLLKTVKRAIDGRPFSWDKLERTAALPPPVPASVHS